MMRAAVAVAALLVLAAAPARAQVVVTADSNLQFGQLTPGVAMTVAPTDAARRASFTIGTPGKYQLNFVLPGVLQRAGGGQIPLVFNATDGRVEVRQKITTFDPSAGVSIHINPADQFAQVFLGGRAQPGPGQPGGVYTATITLIVVHTGN